MYISSAFYRRVGGCSKGEGKQVFRTEIKKGSGGFVKKPKQCGFLVYCIYGDYLFRPLCCAIIKLQDVRQRTLYSIPLLLVDRFLRDEVLVLNPLHPNQHAYQAGKSVETVLHQLVVRVEKALDQQEIALGVFVDIEGAFKIRPMTPCVRHLRGMK